MRQEYEQVCYELLRPGQVRRIREETPIVYIVAGSLEWHGVQNPLGTDSLKAHAICCEAALRYGGVVLPPFYQGLLGTTNWGPAGWEGYTLSFNESEMFRAAMQGICTALVYGGWRVLVGVTGHDVAEQRDAMQAAIAAAVEGRAAAGVALMEGEWHVPDGEIPLAMDHAGAWETSCMLYAYPEKVDLETLKNSPLLGDEDWVVRWGSAEYGPEGISGKNPYRYASAEMGSKIVTRLADLIGGKARELLAQANNRTKGS